MENTQEKYPNLISAKIVADSLNQFGERITTFKIVFPRIILAEFNTHRMFNRNSASSRAIPLHKMVKMVQETPFIPIAWQKSHSGMQGTEYITDLAEIQGKRLMWLAGRDRAIQTAKNLHEADVTKQLANRLLEPFMWTTMLITGSREGWNNFFELRNPVYEVGHNTFKSKKEVLDYYSDDPNFPELRRYSDLDWLKINKGQAEIHIMDLAGKIYDAVNESTPKQLQAGEWHIPMISDLESLKLSTDDQIKLSVGRAANTSYTVVGDGKELTLEHAIKIHDKCVELVHSSVFEHCARAMSDEEYYRFVKGYGNTDYPEDGFREGSYGWCNNLKGFIPYRYFIDNKIEV